MKFDKIPKIVVAFICAIVLVLGLLFIIGFLYLIFWLALISPWLALTLVFLMLVAVMYHHFSE